MLKNILICTHKYTYLPDDALVEFLNDKKGFNIYHIQHSFHDVKDRKSRLLHYVNGVTIQDLQTKDFEKFIEPFIYIKELFYTFFWAYKEKKTFDFYIGMDGLCVLFGLLMRFLGKIKKVNFWVIDFVPENRFKSSIKNKIYSFVNTLSYRNSDEVWDLSPRMSEAREKYLDIKPNIYKKHKIVPFGVWTERIKKYSYSECEKNTLVFMGNLIEKQGVQLVLKAIPLIKKEIPDFKFKIIGGGNYENFLKKLSKDLNVYKDCIFTGKIEDHKILENEVAKSCVAIAPYIKELDTWTYYADPGKVKVYLASGVPLLLTDLPWNAEDIENFGCGRIINTDIENIAKEVIFLMKSSNNQKYRNRAIEYSKSYDYNKIFSSLSF